MIFSVWIPGTAVPQGSAKAFVVQGRARVTSANKGLAAWRSHAVSCIDAQRRKEGPSEPFTGPLHVKLTNYRSRPKSRPKSHERPDTQPDLDKVVRAALDACEAAGLFKNDAQVCEIFASKVYGDFPGVALEVWRME